MLRNLSTFLTVDNSLKETDMVVFGGDFFDKLVDSPNPDMYRTHKWTRRFLDQCKKENPDIKVIWLEGTSSHDWGQPKTLMNLVPEGLDVRYIDTLSIEYFKEFDNLSVMYVPDNMGSLTPDQIWELALERLANEGLEKVDLIFFHGGFEFQLHPSARKQAHNLERWSSIVEYGIFAGHIHKPVQIGKLYTSGSFDRVAHGEEHPKGGYVVDLDKSSNYFNPVFYENKGALPYVTVRVSDKDGPEEVMKKLKAFIKEKNLPRHSQIRVMGGVAMVVNPILNVMSREYPNFGFKAENESKTETVLTEEIFDATLYEAKSLTKENIVDSLLPEIEITLMEKGIDKKEAVKVLEDFL